MFACFPQAIFIHIVFVSTFGFIPGGLLDLFYSVFLKKEKKNARVRKKNVVLVIFYFLKVKNTVRGNKQISF